MGTKTISIRDDIYNLLKNAKREGESYSDVIDRLLVKEKGDFSSYFGVLKGEGLLEGLEKEQEKSQKQSHSEKVISKTNLKAENRKILSKILFLCLIRLLLLFNPLLHSTASASSCFLGRAARQAGGVLNIRVKD